MSSSSAFHFMARNHLRGHNMPSPRFDVGQAKVHRLPVTDGLAINALLLHEGAPIPDRIVLPDWSTPTDSEDSASVS